MDKQETASSGPGGPERRDARRRGDAVTKYVRHLTFTDTDTAKKLRARVWDRAARQGR